jgi:hypothetical protein
VNNGTYVYWVLYTFFSMTLRPFGPCPLFRFLFMYTVGRTPWTSDQTVARPLPTHRTTQTQNKRTQTSMPLEGFEPTIPMFQPVKTVYALDRVATVIGPIYVKVPLNVKLSLYRQWRPLGLREIEAPTFSHIRLTVVARL